MKKRFTQKEKDLTRQIALNFGYWSEQMKNHLETFDYYTKEKAHNYAKQVLRNEI